METIVRTAPVGKVTILPNVIQQPPNKQVVDNTQVISDGMKDIVNAIKGVSDVDRGSLHELVAKPRQIIYTTASATGAGALSQTVYMLNEDYLNVSPTNNGSGAATITKTYNDGFSGNLISRILDCYGNVGLKIKQVQIKATITASGVQDANAPVAANLTLTFYNGDSSSLPQVIPVASTGNPNYNQQGFLVISVSFTLKRYSQLSFILPAGDTMQVILIPE